MGESEQRQAPVYTPDELNEIGRIVDVIEGYIYGPHEAGEVVASPPRVVPLPSPDFEESEDSYMGEPDDLDLPSTALDDFSTDGRKAPKAERFDDDLDITEIPMEDLSEVSQDDSAVEEVFSGDDLDLAEISDDDLDRGGAAEMEDISDLIEEVREPRVDEDDFIEDITTDLVEEPETMEEGFPGEEPVSFDETEFEKAAEIPAGRKRKSSPLDELNALTAEEPESLDIQELAEQDLVGEPAEEAWEEEAPVEEFSDGDISDIDMDELPSLEEPPELHAAARIDKEIDTDIPDLSDLSLEEAPEMAEAADTDIPDIDLGDMEAGFEGGEELSSREMPGIEEFEEVPEEIDDFTSGDIGEEPIISSAPDRKSFADVDDIDIEPIDDESGSRKSQYADDSGDLAIEPLEEAEEERGRGYADTGEETLELTEKELKKLKKAIILFSPGMRSAIKDTVINDLIPPGQIRKLVDMILEGRSEKVIQQFLEKKLGRSISTAEEVSGRKVIHARPEYTREGRERQKRLLKFTRVFGIAAAAAFVVTILSYQFIYKPVMAKTKIKEGVALILQAGDYAAKPRDYEKAEELARYVEENYAENYIYGFNEYGRAYQQKKEYNRAFDKFNKSYKIDPQNIDTLNQLGYFYARIPAEFYSGIQSEVEKNYYPKETWKNRVWPQLDVSINFYKRSLLLDPENVAAMQGIGNAYFYQGQYVKARKYYLDILKVDRKSVVGFSGLLNLYIERDAYDLVASTHREVQDLKILNKLPPPLLAKMAYYYMSKSKSDSFNVRVDYGVQSPRLRDVDDNTYPAVESVLSALNSRDPDYPPLLLMRAKFARMQNNQKLAKLFLDRAVKGTPNYFGALHLMGRHFYEIKQPVEAYEYLNRAIRASGNPPEFTQDDFYKETEQLGETYALLGNIFYYFFDKVKYRYGSLEDELIEEDVEKMANYNVAREKYELSISENYSSPEVHYNLGRIYYLNRQYRKSLDQWLFLYEDFVRRPELMYALGNSFYHLGNYEAAKGEYLKLISVAEYEAENIRMADLGNSEHVRLFQSLASAYNNLGAIYQLQGDDSRSSLSYWKAIDYAKRLEIENEYARVNLARSINRQSKSEPIIDENVPYSIDYYREDMRQ
ncbi:MAG: hypothetical protein CVV44_07390 [Spirochaetae bacterium HGW-Spirochaetae-1]|jgi:tetratricopeptide (TPR) repeat protein|nr:MAG: hypothetical protein CVV44_07390 [Spirochaetae bacterium HGW-Spirochaetae-1]